MHRLTIAPLRRFPEPPGLFDYLSGEDLRPGQLVRVPFRGRPVDGVVWKSPSASPDTSYPLKNILGIRTAAPVTSQWQHEQIGRFCQDYDYSPSSFLHSLIPAWTERTLPKGLISVSKIATTPAASRMWWYNDRSDILERIASWAAAPGPRVILVPTIEDAEALQALLPVSELVHSRMTPKQYRLAYERVLSGQASIVVGTSKALFLPFPSRPEILIDQEEHRQYKQSSQHPAYDVVRFLERQQLAVTSTSPAPRVRSYLRLHPEVPAVHATRRLGTLGVPQHDPWVAPETSEYLRANSPATTLWIVPRRGYASTLVCRDCGTVAACRTCQHRIRLLRVDATHARCAYCQDLQPLPTSCPKCQSTRWMFKGIGPERWLSDMLARQQWPSSLTDTFRVGTYRDINMLRALPGPRLVVVVSGDALIGTPDFSAEETAWQYLNRIDALVSPGDSIVVQTFEPQHPVWQHWVTNDAQVWYNREIESRAQHRLPPAVDQWIAVWVGPGQETALEQVHHQIKDRNLAVTVVELATRQQRATHTPQFRYLVSPTNGTGLPSSLRSELFPYPWRVDIDVDSWLA